MARAGATANGSASNGPPKFPTASWSTPSPASAGRVVGQFESQASRFVNTSRPLMGNPAFAAAMGTSTTSDYPSSRTRQTPTFDIQIPADRFGVTDVCDLKFNFLFDPPRRALVPVARRVGGPRSILIGMARSARVRNLVLVRHHGS